MQPRVVRHTAARPLRVGLLAPPALAVPPADYGGTEAVVHALAAGLRRLGCDVRVAAAGIVPGGFAEPVGLGLPPAEALACDLAHAAHSLAAMADRDIVHDHTKAAGCVVACLAGLPLLTTVHNDRGPGRERVYAARPHHSFVFLSQAHARRYPGIAPYGIVPNGVDLGQIPFRARGREGYVLFLGRFSRVKGPAMAIAACRRAGLPLVVAGTVDPSDPGCFEEDIAPHVDGRAVRLVGPVGGARKWELLARARALLAPHCWEEPFGLTMVEAMACGTPAITTRRGAGPELVRHRLTGWLAEDPAGLEEGLAAAERIDPYACRAWVASRFSADAMARAYLDLYERLLASRGDTKGGVA
ncbi:MAG: glycosyltransferase [Candidatus Sericytochromatia bacterium]|nr:glycosyltransferase [Candidatus Tanganyikabacteria bacterium]